LVSTCRCNCSSAPTTLSNSDAFAAVHESGIGRYCCKSPKIPGGDFFERNEANLCSPINMAPRPLAKPPVSLSRGDEVPHVFIGESHQRARKILISSGKRLLQQNRHSAAEPACPHSRRVLEGKRTIRKPTSQEEAIRCVSAVDLPSSRRGRNYLLVN
jgi:hypothetical protein